MTIADTNGYHRVSTGGGVILDVHAGSRDNYNLVPLPGMELTCGIDATADRDDNDFRIAKLAGAIVLDLKDTIALSNDSASLAHCNVVAGETSGGVVTNPYSPAYWYPDCNPNYTTCDDTGHTAALRSAIDEYSAFNPNPTAAYHDTDCTGHCGPASASVGITITGRKNAVRNVTAMGFGKCYSSVTGGKSMIIEHLTGDCDGGISIDSSHEATQMEGIQIKPFLTNNNGAASLVSLKIHDLQKDMTTGKYTVTVELSGGFQFLENDTVWVDTDRYHSDSGRGTGAESAAGRWIAGTPSPVSCGTGITCQMFVLNKPNSSEPDSRYSDSGSPLTILNATLNSSTSGVPANAISGISTVPLSTNQQTLQLVAVGQTVTDSGGCIPAGTIVTNVWPAQGIVYISNPATCSPDTMENVGFYDATFQAGSGCSVTEGGEGCAIVDANERFGDGIVVSESGGSPYSIAVCSSIWLHSISQPTPAAAVSAIALRARTSRCRTRTLSA